MPGSRSNIRLAFFVAIACCLWTLGPMNSEALAQRFGGGRGGEPFQPEQRRPPIGRKQYKTQGVPIDERPPHGGQVSKDVLYFFEVVYQPQMTHVYIYGPSQEPILSEYVRGEIVLQPHYLKQAFQFPLKFAPGQPEVDSGNHLAVAVDTSHVRDGDMTVTFKFENLPLPTQPKATFTQTFALTRPPQTAAANPPGADRAGQERQPGVVR